MLPPPQKMRTPPSSTTEEREVRQWSPRAFAANRADPIVVHGSGGSYFACLLESRGVRAIDVEEDGRQRTHLRTSELFSTETPPKTKPPPLFFLSPTNNKCFLWLLCGFQGVISSTRRSIWPLRFVWKVRFDRVINDQSYVRVMTHHKASVRTQKNPPPRTVSGGLWFPQWCPQHVGMPHARGRGNVASLRLETPGDVVRHTGSRRTKTPTNSRDNVFGQRKC